MLDVLLLLAAGFAGFTLARGFVRRRLRFVGAVHSPLAPVVAGVAAAIVVWPLAVLPLLTTATALAFGVGIGLGTASGARALRHAEQGTRHLTP